MIGSFRVVQEPDGRWLVDVRGVLPNGEAFRKRCRPKVETRRDAEKYARDIWRAALDGAIKSRRYSPKLADFFDRWIRDHCEANRHKTSGIASNRKIYAKHLAWMGELCLHDIDDATVSALKARCADGDLSAKTTNNVLTLLGSMLKSAVRWKVLAEAPRVSLLKVQKKRMPFLSVEHYDRLVDGARAVGPQAAALILLAGDGGLRASEILALEWRDIDLDRRVMAVRRAEVLKVVDDTKGRAERGVPITSALAEALDAIKRASGRVMRGRGKGGRMDRKTLNELVRQSEAMALLPVTGKLHILRHTYASLLASAGASIYQLQEAMGHRDTATTAIYAKLDPMALRALSDIIDTRRGAGRAGQKALPQATETKEEKSGGGGNRTRFGVITTHSAKHGK
jgi:integrase